MVDSHGVTFRQKFIPAKGSEEWAIAFPYYRGAELVNVKYRTTDKAFAQEKDGVGIFQSRDEYNQFFGGLKSLGDPEINAMLPMINDFVLGRPIGSTPMAKGGGNGMMDLLGNQTGRRMRE